MGRPPISYSCFFLLLLFLVLFLFVVAVSVFVFLHSFWTRSSTYRNLHESHEVSLNRWNPETDRPNEVPWNPWNPETDRLTACLVSGLPSHANIHAGYRMPPHRAWAHATHARHLCPATHARHLCPASERGYLVKTEVSNDGRHLCPCWLLEKSHTGTSFLDLWPSHLPVSFGSRGTKDFASAYLAKVNLSHVVHLRLCWRDPGKGAAGRNAPWVCLRPMLLCHLGWGRTLQKSTPDEKNCMLPSQTEWYR